MTQTADSWTPCAVCPDEDPCVDANECASVRAALRAPQTADSVACDHPSDAIMWNPWNRVMQCHRCGYVSDRTPMPSEDAVRYTPPPIDGSGTSGTMAP